MSTPLQLGFQDPASLVMSQFHWFHDYAMCFIVFITILVLYALSLLAQNLPSFWKLVEKQNIELWWTISPSFILIALAVPSIKLLYWIDEGVNPEVTVKTVGHQWYWSYEFWDNSRIELDSYMINTEDLTISGLPRLLEVDNRLVLPIETNIRVVTHSTDVIHAWCVPTLGVKMDAVPGRLNQLFVEISRPGVYYGQCSEICGANHSFMPIVIEAVPQQLFYAWCESITEE
uniref:Cytochrome c oxidase subunit 2 n=1 Tax=Macrophiothrix sp. TaxID=3135532 RepID=A0AAU6PX71_9ECHI